MRYEHRDGKLLRITLVEESAEEVTVVEQAATVAAEVVRDFRLELFRSGDSIQDADRHLGDLIAAALFQRGFIIEPSKGKADFNGV